MDYQETRVKSAVREMEIDRENVDYSLQHMHRKEISTANRRLCYDNAEKRCCEYQQNLRRLLAAIGLGVEEWGDKP